MGANRAPTGMRHTSHDTRPAHVTGMFVHSRHANYGKEITLRVKGPSGIFDARSPPDLMLRMYKTGCTDLRGLAIFITRPYWNATHESRHTRVFRRSVRTVTVKESLYERRLDTSDTALHDLNHNGQCTLVESYTPQTWTCCLACARALSHAHAATCLLEHASLLGERGSRAILTGRHSRYFLAFAHDGCCKEGA